MVSTAAFHARVRGSVPGLGGLKETKMFFPHPRVKVSIVGSLRDREVACSASDRQGSNFESCVWRTVSSQSSHHPQEVLLAQFSLYVHKGGLKPDSFHFILHAINLCCTIIVGPSYTMSSQLESNIGSASFICVIVHLFLCKTRQRYQQHLHIPTTLCLMLGQHLRLWININPALGHRSYWCAVSLSTIH